VARLTTVRQIWTFIFGYAIAILALIFGPARALRILEAHEYASPAYASGVVLLGTVSLLPLIALLVWMYRRSDEYERHGMLLTTTIGFALSLLAMAALDLLRHTDLLPAWTWSPRWWTILACWIVGMISVQLIRRRST
jgi:hypothetical protein